MSDDSDDGDPGVALDSGRKRPVAQRVWAAAAVLLLLMVGEVLSFAVPTTRGTESYSTVLSEQRQVKLEDGVVIEAVNGDSNVKSLGEPRHLLKSGDVVSVDLAGKIRTNPPNFQRAQNWLQRRLVFNGETLDEVVAEFNRYNQTQIIIEGKELNARPVDGVFDADHPQTLFLFLMKADPRVIVDATNSGKTIIRFRSPAGS